MGIHKTDVEQKRKIRPISYMTFIQTDKIRDSYDSYKMLETAKTKDYMSRAELAMVNKE